MARLTCSFSGIKALIQAYNWAPLSSFEAESWHKTTKNIKTHNVKSESDTVHETASDAQDEQSQERMEAPGRMETIAAESRGLFEDLKEWVDLRVQLVQMEIEERIEKTANQVISVIAVVILALFSSVFLLHALALFAAEWLGSLALGYLSVGAVLAMITTIVHLSKPRFIKRTSSGKAKTESSKLQAPQEHGKLPVSTQTGSRGVDGEEQTRSEAEGGAAQ